MKFLIKLFIIIISLILFFKYLFPFVISEIKNYKKMDQNEKDKNLLLSFIFLIPLILLFCDYFNLFSFFFPHFDNFTKEYDWLSFIGAYFAAFASSIMLIFITEKDRSENTKVMREAQRPYLDVSFMIIKSGFFSSDNNNMISFEHGNKEDKKNIKKEFLTLHIRNSGASVAIIDINKTLVKLQFKKEGKIVCNQLSLNSACSRLSVKSGEIVCIKFIKSELYDNEGYLLKNSKILSSTIYYKDLFNKNYYDECELRENLIVLHDNEKIDE